MVHVDMIEMVDMMDIELLYLYINHIFTIDTNYKIILLFFILRN